MPRRTPPPQPRPDRPTPSAPPEHVPIVSLPEHVTLSFVLPPYTAATEPPSAPKQSLPRGSVLLLHAEAPREVALPELESAVTQLRTAVSLPVALRLGGPNPLDGLYLAGSARDIGCSAVLLECQPLDHGLREFLVNPRSVADEWVRWLQLRRGLPGQLRDTLRALIRTAPVALDLPDLCSRIETPMRTLAHRLQQAGLPKPERWYDGSRILHGELELQRCPRLRIDEVAERLDYADDLSFSNRAYRLFGVTPVTSRKLLGLEWRFREWWLRAHR